MTQSMPTSGNSSLRILELVISRLLLQLHTLQQVIHLAHEPMVRALVPLYEGLRLLEDLGAPECFRPDHTSFLTRLKVNPDIDIWSLGCIYSECMRWMAHGNLGIEEYRKERSEEFRQASGLVGGLDCFHNEISVLQSVRKSHQISIAELQQKEFVTQPVVEMLDCIVNMIESMLSSSGARPDTRTLWNQKISIIRKAEEGLKRTSGECIISFDCQPPVSKELLAKYPRPPNDGPPARPPILPPEYAHVNEEHQSITVQRRGSKRSYSEMVVDEPGHGLTRSPEIYSDDFPAQQTPSLSQHNSPFGTPSPYSLQTPVFRSTFSNQNHGDEPFVSRINTNSQLNHPDKYSSLNSSFFPLVGDIENNNVGDCQTHSPSMLPPDKLHQKVPSSVRPTPPRPPQQPILRRQTNSDYVTLDNVLDWKLGKTSNTDPSVPYLNRDLINRLHDREFVSDILNCSYMSNVLTGLPN